MNTRFILHDNAKFPDSSLQLRTERKPAALSPGLPIKTTAPLTFNQAADEDERATRDLDLHPAPANHIKRAFFLLLLPLPQINNVVF